MEQARSAINRTKQDVARVLIGDGEVFAGRVEPKMAGRFSAARLFADAFKSAFFRLDFKDRERISAAVGGIEKFSVWMHGNFSPAVMTGEIARQGGDSLYFGEGPR